MFIIGDFIMNIRRKRIRLIIKKWVGEIILIAVGCIIMAVGTSLFLLPNKLSSGGFAGISTILYYLFNFPLGTTILILNMLTFKF